MPSPTHRIRFLRDHRWLTRHSSEYLDRELDPVELRRADRHTGECASCRELLRSLRSLIEALGAIGQHDPPRVPPAVVASIQGRLRDLPQGRP